MFWLLACAPDMMLTLGEGPTVQVTPDPIVLRRDETCSRTEVQLQGHAVLLGVEFLVEEGEETAIRLPPVSEVDLEHGLGISLDYCPEPAPVSGWLLLDFQDRPQMSVWAEEG